MSDSETRPIKVLMVAAEAVPFVKTGGLADVAGSLPRALNQAGAEVSVILPKYSKIPQEYRDQMELVAEFYVPLAWRQVYCGIQKLVYDGVTFYFVDNEDYFKREGGPYGYGDDGERFAYFSKAVCQAIMWVPELQVDVVHCNDWQAALIPVFLREFYRESDACNHVKVMFTVHNVKFQGQYGSDMMSNVLGLDGIPAAVQQLYRPDGSIDYMQGALCYSDSLTTVSPSYAVELQMPFYGEGLDGIFRRRNGILRGILNGIDVKAWNPASDALFSPNYDAATLDVKAECKRKLQEELGLDQDPTRPLVVMIGRLTNQKGLGLVRYAMDRIMSRGVQVAILGTGDPDQEEAFRYFAGAYPGKMAAVIDFDNALSHRMYAGGDILLMPSEFEPCGLSQMIAMRYGTLPVVRETGGLRDSVVPYNQFTGEGTGFSFANMNADEMYDALLGACEVFWTDQEAWRKLQVQAMSTDFSWSRAAVDYLDLYYGMHPEMERPAAPEPVAEAEPEPAKKPAAKRTRAKKPAAKKSAAEAKAAEPEAEPKPAAKKRTTRKSAAKKAAEAAKPEAKAEPAAEAKADEAAPTAEVKAGEPVVAEAKKPAAKKPAAKKTAAKKATTAAAATEQAVSESEPKAEVKPAPKKRATRKPAAKKAADADAKKAEPEAKAESGAPAAKPAKKPAAKGTGRTTKKSTGTAEK